MAYKVIKDGGGESDSLLNKMMTTDEVKLLIKQIMGESTDFEMEPVEVVDFTDDGSITGRYVVSEHDKSINELLIESSTRAYDAKFYIGRRTGINLIKELLIKIKTNGKLK